jgi:hypothetical protein
MLYNDDEWSMYENTKHDPVTIDRALDMSVYKQLADEFGGDSGMIENILPCTLFQRDVMEWTASKPDASLADLRIQVLLRRLFPSNLV